MTFFPNRAVFVSFGAFEIRWYAIFILCGALFGYWWMSRGLKKNGYIQDVADSLFIGCLLFGIIGARIWYVLFSDLSYYLADPVRIFRVWEGGLAIHGGLIFGVGYAVWYCHKHKMSFLRTADCTMPAILVAQAVGRWGNFMNQEAYGQPVSEEYFAHWPKFLNFIKEGMFINGTYQEPMFFYESCLCLLGFFLILLYQHTSHPRRGDLTGCYFLWYGAIRFWIEKDRSDSLMFLGLKMAQLVSIALIILGILCFSGVFRKLEGPSKPVILLDNDGTIVNTVPLIKQSFIAVFQQYKPDYQLSEEELDSFIGPSLEDSFARYFPAEKVPEVCEAYRRHNQTVLKDVQANPGVKETLAKWHEEGFTMGIVSTKKVPVIEQGLAYAGLPREWFQLILGPEDVSKPKPDPEGVLMACRRMNVSHDDVVYIGDSVTDIQAARNAGMYSVGFSVDPHRLEDLRHEKPNMVAAHFADIDPVVHRHDISWSWNLR